jgi:hypothetical protein
MHYFINSKRRFFVYFKSYEQMIETMYILAQNSVRFTTTKVYSPTAKSMKN